METAAEVTRTYDENIEYYLGAESKASAKVIEIAQRPITPEEYEEPHEYNGFGD